MTIHTNPPKTCDLCKAPLHDTFYDAALPALGGVWGNTCEPCFRNNGGSLGTGRGQKFTLHSDDRFHKVAG